MTLAELLPCIHSLDRADKLRLIQLIAEDIAKQEVELTSITSNPIPIWTPHDSFEGADTLLKMLDQDGAST